MWRGLDFGTELSELGKPEDTDPGRVSRKNHLLLRHFTLSLYVMQYFPQSPHLRLPESMCKVSIASIAYPGFR